MLETVVKADNRRLKQRHHEEMIEALNRVSDSIEEHHKVLSKIAHIIGFKLEEIEKTLSSGRH